MIKDILGRPIKIGDKVACASGTGSSGYAIVVKYVVKMTEKSCFLANKQNDIDNGTRKQSSKILVIDAQYKNNLDEYPELYI